MAKVDEKKCPGCGGGIIDITKEPFVLRGTRYWHEDCLKKKHPNEIYEISQPIEKKKREVKPKVSIRKCYYCGKEFDIEKEEWAKPVTNRYAHKACYEANYTEDQAIVDEIYAYLTSLLIKYDFLMCEKQRLSYIKKNGYTNEGILLALKYFYEVKKQSPDRSGNRIGIVPYVYDEAQAYYEELYKKKKQIAKNAKKIIGKEKKIITIEEDDNNVVNKGYIDIDKLGE